MRNNLMMELMMLKQQGMDPASAMQQLAQRYPQFQQALPYLQGKTPQQMDATGRNFAQSMGLNPMQMISQLMGRR